MVDCSGQKLRYTLGQLLGTDSGSDRQIGERVGSEHLVHLVCGHGEILTWAV